MREGGHLHEPLVTVNIFPWLIFIQNFGEMKFYLKIVLDFWKQGKNNTGIIFCLMEFGWKFVIHLQLKSRVEFRNFKRNENILNLLLLLLLQPIFDQSRSSFQYARLTSWHFWERLKLFENCSNTLKF